MYKMINKYTKEQQPTVEGLADMCQLFRRETPVKIDGLGCEAWIAEIGWSNGCLVLEIRRETDA